MSYQIKTSVKASRSNRESRTVVATPGTPRPSSSTGASAAAAAASSTSVSSPLPTDKALGLDAHVAITKILDDWTSRGLTPDKVLWTVLFVTVNALRLQHGQHSVRGEVLERVVKLLYTNNHSDVLSLVTKLHPSHSVHIAMTNSKQQEPSEHSSLASLSSVASTMPHLPPLPPLPQALLDSKPLAPNLVPPIMLPSPPQQVCMMTPEAGNILPLPLPCTSPAMSSYFTAHLNNSSSLPPLPVTMNHATSCISSSASVGAFAPGTFAHVSPYQSQSQSMH